jgi:FAD:protein FMN transferase
VESLLTRYRSDSEIGRLNLGAFAGPQRVSEETAGVLAGSLRWAEASGGAFDPCLARAVGFWDVGNRTMPPDVFEVRRYAGRGLFKALEIDRFAGDRVVVFHEEDMGVDLGGIGKGYGVDRAVDVLRSWGIRDGLVNVGGDLYALGVSEDGDDWSVGVRSPDDPRRLATTLNMSDRAVATSGDYQQYFEHLGRRYHHLLDPRTGAPSEVRVRSVTVAASTCMEADAGATTAFVLSPQQARGIMERVAPGSEVVHTV